jgi:hypothetical protein
LSDLALRPKIYDNVDGTAELSMGLMVLAFAVIALLAPVFGKLKFLPAGLAGLLIPMYGTLLLFMAIGAFLRKAIKKHITYPRTGYAANLTLRRWGKKTWWLAVLGTAGSGAVAMAVALAAGLLQKHHETIWIRFMMIPLFVAPYAFFTSRLSPEHGWKNYLAAAMAAGLLVIALLAPGGIIELSGPVLFFSAMTWLASAVVTLVIYIRNTERPVPGEE